ncbi:YadA-like family protein [Burkholderia metallica]|uniref:YadA-like family protein n=1 Tax=Burkholderia metallica TaxID=488729 RepID=UPI0021F47BCD|nr:YadA-like family protein [Burkholderia metallica]
MGSAYADEVDAADPTLDDPVRLTDSKPADPAALKRGAPDTRAVVSDNSAYVKINAKGDGTDNASAMGENSIAIGSSASTRPSATGLGGAVAVGNAATAAGNNVALGAKASALGDEGAIALGAGANASGKASIALGNEAQAAGWGAYALGRKAKANAESALAIGDSSMATRQGTMAIGSQAAAAAENAIAIGQSAAARGADSLALGSYSEADRDQTVSVGTAGFERQIINVGRGTQATDAVNVAQLKGVTEALGGNATVGADGNIKKPAYTIGTKTYDNVGDALLAASASGGGAENAVEYDSDAKNSVTLGGTGAAVVKLTNVRAATLSSTSTDAVNGAQLFATNNRVTNVEQSLNDSGLIDPSTGESLAVVYNNATKSTVSLGGTGGTVLTNVKAGRIASASKDAVNGGQLYDVSSSVASALGGESAVNADGTISKPAYKVGDKTYSNVGDALQAAAAAGGAGGEDANAVHYDGAGKASVTLGGAGASTPVALKNVATGQAATDAVNVAQLQSGMSDVKDEIKQDLGNGTLNMKYIKVNATGMQANALGKNSVAIGSQANATNVDTLAIGSGARASGMNSIAIGVNSVAAGANTVSIGDVGATRRIVNVSDGVDDTDAVNMKQLTDAMHSANTKLDAKMTRMVRDVESKPGSFVAIEGLGADGSLPNIASMNGRDPNMGTAAAIGVASGAGGINAIAVGLQAVASSDHSVAIGSIAQTGVDQPYSVAMGSMVTTNGAGALAIGSRAKANADNAVAVGNNGVAAVGKSSIAIGDKAMTAAGTVNSVAMGKSANVAQNVTDAIALGANASVASGNNGGIALGANSVADRGNALSVGSNSLQRQIVNVAKGTKNNDAVNVSQLTGVTNALGGGAGIGTDGNITAPTYKVGDTTYNNVGDALDAMAKNGGSDPNAVSYDSATKDKVTLAGGTTGTTLSNVKAGTADMDAVNVSQLKSSGLIGEDGKSIAAITYDKNTDGTPNYKSATLAGEGGTTLTNVKAGALSATSTDAVNGSQLFATNENLGNLKDTLTDGGVIDKTTGESLAVVYDSTTKDKVTLAGGKTGTTLSNVKAGTADMDAVNVSQLKSSGLIDGDGKSIAAVTYDKKTDGTPNYNSVTLGGGKSTGPVTLSNVAQGKANTDAVNVEQLTKAISDVEGGMNPLAVSYDSVTKDKVTLAGGTTGTKLSNVKAGTADMDAVNVSQLKSSGLIGEDGKSIAAVTYDKNTDGTPNYKSATLAGEGGTTLTNVKAGALSATSTDAVNGSQLFATNENLGNLKDTLTDGGVIDKTTGESLAVVYDSTTKDKVTLAGGKTGTTLSNVKAGTADMDAVNVSQLKSSGLVGEDGKSRAAVTYDKNTDGTPNYKSATLAGEGGTTLTNVKAGALSATSTDAVNGSQLFATNENLGNLKDTLTDGGVIDKTTGESLAVVYDSTTKDKVTLAGGKTGTTLSNVAAGTADMDAVNVSQLKSSGLVGEDGKSRAAVTYDKNTDGTPNYKSATLAGEGGTTLTNVKAGALSATSTDAVNGSQLFATNENLGNLKDTLTDGGVIDKTTGESLAVVYDSTTKDKVTLAGGKTGTTLSNVKAGTADMDAVNVSQLKSSGLIDGDGKSIAAVTYDKKTDGMPNYNSVTLGGGKSTGPVTLSNVAQGKAGTDAVNVDQLTKAIGDVEGGMNPLAVSYDSMSKDKVTLAGGKTGTMLTNVAAGKVSADSKDAVNGSQLHGTAQSVADALGGRSAVDENGKLKAPTYTLADPADDTKKVDYHTVGDALENLDGRVASNTGDITHIKNQFTNTGLVDADGDTRAAVTYDKNKDGTPNYQSATLAGKGGTKLTNVAAGTADTDAVNVSQLKSSGLVGEDGKSRAAVTYDKNTDGTPNYKSATLAGEGGTTLTNVKAGALSATSTDAVNGSQLFATNENLGNLKDTLTDGGVIDKTTGESLAVVYDSTTKDKVTLAGGKTGTTLSNVKAGTADMDAVNVSQLKSSGLIDGDGKSIAAVTYDKKTDGTPNYNSVTLGGGKSTGPVTLSNVAKGKVGTDAVNVDQLTDALRDVEGGMNPLAVAYDTAKKDKVTLAGEGGTKLSNVKAGTADMDAVNVSQLKSSGLVGEDGKSRAAVTYDKNADGTPNYTSATLAGEGGTKLLNVKAGTADTDAVNVSQLKSSGLVGEDGKSRAAVTYDKNADGTPKYTSATLAGEGGTTLSNVKAGTKDMDAVNVSQLKSSGLVDGDGKSRAAVTYDKNADGTPNYTSATLAGEGGTKLSNVKAGTADMDAVNVSQLKSTGLIGDDGKTLAAVTYDKKADGTPNYKSATLAGEGGTKLSNVADGKADKDAVNVSQLKSSGLIGEDGKSLAAVTYDKNADGTPNYKSATLAGEGGTKLSNVKAGTADMDAVNVSQLKSTGLIGEDGKSRAAVTYDKNADGTPNYKSATLAGEGGTKLSNVKAGTADADAVNVSQLKSSGLIDGDGKSIAAVTYDKNADGTPNYKRATLAGEGGTTLSNVAAGKADKDAVNVSQLKSSGLIGEDGKSIAAVTYDKNTDGTANHESVTLAGKTGTKLTNVKAAELSATSMDAVNGSQLFATNESLGNLKDALTDGGVIDEKTGESLAVVYDSTSKDKVTLAGDKTGTTLSNVKAGTADLDAVNVSQLKSSGLIDEDGKSIAAVTYDKKADGTTNYGSVTLGGGKSTGPVTLSNVAAGKAGTDAVNVDQLNDLEDSLVNGAIRLKYIKVNSEGRDAIARGPESVAIGANAWATRPQAMALGSGSRANGVNSVAIGYNSVADDDNTVAVGNVGEERRVVHLAAGVDDTDAVNMKQLTDAMHSANTKLDAKMTRMVRDVESKPGSFVAIEGLGADGSMPNIASMNGRDPKMGTAAAIGVGSGASGINSIAVGLQAVSNSDHSVAIGSIAQTGVDQPYAVAMGSMVTTNGAGALAIGSRAKANAENAVAVGNNGVVAVGKSSIAIGDKAMTKAGTVNSIAIGTNANVQQNVADAIALGANSQALSSNSVALGANSLADRANALSIGSAGAERQIIHVAKGTQNTDAVNLAQLKGLADVVGGGTGFDANGDVTAPTYTIDGKEYHNVNDALQAAAKSGNDGGNGTDPNAVAYDGAQKDLVTLAGQNGTTLSNVAAGKADMDAVNVSQLKSSGLIGEDGKSVAAVTYEKNADGTPNYKSVKLAGEGGTILSNVAAGNADTDAVNVSQLKSSGLIGDDGKSIAAVTYDRNLDGTTNYGSVSLGGGKTADPVTLSNVAKGKTGTDAVNVDQLTDAIRDVEGGMNPLALAYDNVSKDKATLAGQGGTTLSNVAAGKADMDAVNVAQLKSSGLIGESGKSLSAVTYDTHADGSTNFASVTFGGVNAGVPVALHNIAAGKASTDAVNVSQLKGVTDAIGGGSGIDADGKVTAPVYSVDGKDYASVGDAIKALEQREGGAGNGATPNAVAYDDAAKSTVTLAGAQGTVIRNVADGSVAQDSTEAINGSQLNFVAQSIADSLGGGAKVDPVTGDVSAPVYELTEADGSKMQYDNVGDAFTHLDDRVSSNTTQIETLQKGVANAVQYDDATHASVTLGGVGSAPVTLKNVSDGVDETDAVNVRQLRSAGLVGEDGTLQSAVVYDKNADGTTNYGSVTLGGVGAATPVALHNVAAGKAATDAVNVSQLSGVTDALGGGAKVDEETGKVIAPTYDVGGNTFHNAGDALTNIDNRVTQIQDNLGEATKLVGAVAYDKNGDGTVNFNKVTLGNGLSSGPVVLTNVADGKSQYDAVNYGQFSKLEGRVNDIDDRLHAATKPGDGNNGNNGGSGNNGNGLINGTGGSGEKAAEILAAKPGTGNGNVAAGSDSMIADGKHNSTAIGAGSKVQAEGGTAIGHGATVSSGATNSVALGEGSKATEANTVSVGSDGHERRIVNVADGVKATDAVSKGQFDRALGGMQGQINDISRNAYSGIAAATALTMIPGVDPGKTLSFGIGGGSYKGYQAVAMGGEARITENLKMRAGVGLSSGGNTFGVGASYQW